jgi:AraC family ethanolamine operon transcriptional activator
MMSSTVVDDDTLVATVVTRSAPGARWCGQFLDAGDVLIHGPETLHTAFNPEGFSFAFAAVPVVDVRRASEDMKARFDAHTGRFLKLPPSPAARRLGRAIASAFPRMSDHQLAGAPSLASLNAVAADAIHSTVRGGRESASRRISDSAIVTACINAALEDDRYPGIAEMRRAAHVSERRLRSAFVQEFGVPPSVFFRSWTLDQARRRLLDSSERGLTVGRVATDLGFRHLGRFAAYYHRQFGEHPSVTLARSMGTDLAARLT